MKLFSKYKEQILYLFFGCLTTLISLVVYYGLTLSILDATNAFELQVANILSWICGFLFAYVTNRKYVFASNNKKGKEFLLFFLSRISTLILDMLIMFVFVTVLKFNDAIFKIISQVAVIVINYILSKIVVFKK